MGTPVLVGVAVLASGITGGKVGMDTMRGTVDWAQAIHRADVQHLASGQKLPPIEEPPGSSRKPRSGFLVWLLGPLIGAVLGFLAVLLFVQLLAETSSEVTGFEQLFGGVFFGWFGAVVGGLLGALLGGLFYVMEMRARMAAFKAALRRAVWEQREQLRDDLNAGRVSPAEAVAQLEQVLVG